MFHNLFRCLFCGIIFCLYKLFYILFKDVDVSSHAHTISGLKKHTEYSFRVVAYNKHGPGVSTQDVAVRTFSDGKFLILEQTTTMLRALMDQQ